MRQYVGGLAIFLLCPVHGRGLRGEGQPELPSRERFHLFLLAGQSNMSGRGRVEERDRTPHPRVLAFTRDGKWAPARDPIHFDKKWAGVGPGRSFGIALADADKDITVGLIPCAAGGTPISSWRPGEGRRQTQVFPYDDAVKRARLAMKDGVLKGILWHQGEGDCRPDLAKVYEEKLQELIARFRKDLDAPDVPFIIGQLGQDPEKPPGASRKLVDRAHRGAADRDRLVGFVPSDGLTCNKDGIHFNARSQREFGRRYAEVYSKIAKEVDKDAQPCLPAGRD